MLRSFTAGFTKFKSLLLLVAFPSLIGTLLHRCQLEGSCYDCQ